MIRGILTARAFVLAAPLHAQPADDAAKLGLEGAVRVARHERQHLRRRQGAGGRLRAIDCTARITMRQVLQMRVLGKPGSNFLYNPIVFGRLANWVEEKTGKPFDHWVRRYVIDKAGLKNWRAMHRESHHVGRMSYSSPTVPVFS